MQPRATQPPVVLKKYGNRRLYDTGQSRYVTLAEVEEMLQSGRDLEVRDAKTGEDLTRAVLVQIIAERPQSRDVLPLEFLKQVVRTSASPDKGRFQEVLLGWIDAFSQAQRGVLDQMQQVMAQAARASSGLLNPFGRPPPRPPAGPVPSPADIYQPRSPAPEPSGGPEPVAPGELDEIRSQLAQTQALLQELLRERTGPPPAPSAEPRTADEPDRA